MGTCILSVILFVFPVSSDEPDEYDDKSLHVNGCFDNHRIERTWIKHHAFYIETKRERIRIALPPVKDPVTIGMSYDLQSDRVTMGEWGRIFVTRGPKEPV